MPVAQPKAFKGFGMEGFTARWYAKTTRNDAPEIAREAKDVAARLPHGAGVLEVAPGPGYFAIELSKLGNFHIVGLDISRTFVQIAKQNAGDANVPVEFRHGNAAAMPFADDSFDFIFCRAAFKNFSEPAKALDEMHRVLRPGGRALIVDLNKNVTPEDIDAYLRQSGRGRVDSMLTRWTFKHMLIKRAYTPADFERMAAESHFGSCRITAAPLGMEIELTKRRA